MSNRLKTFPKREGGLLCTDRQKMNTPEAIYHLTGRESIPKLKEKIGCLLLCLLTGDEQTETWQIFDRLLRQLYEGTGTGFHRLKSTNFVRGVSK